MGTVLTRSMKHRLLELLALALFCQQRANANPAGGVVTQGGATIQNSGSQLTVTTTGNTAINWQSFSIAAGETTTFIEPTSTSVVWNQISSGSPSQILGNLNANGYVILQNAAGIYIGGQACISTHGLMLTTAPINMPNLSGGGAWQFDAPPPLAKIINYGQINIAGGGSAFLLAADIENNGTISAPSGNIGLYAGENVLVSMSPDGRSLSSVVTLPQGSVDNEGKLIADAGTIAAQAQTVNQNGLVQANSVQNINGTIELVASENLSLGAASTISAQGDSQGVSAGGNVTIKSGNSFSDQTGSTINIGGGAQGGNGGNIEISAPEMSSIQSAINGQAAAGYVNGELTIDPYNIQLVGTTGTTGQSGTSGEYSSGTVSTGDSPTGTGSTLLLNINSFASTLSAINLQAVNNIEISKTWTLANQTVPSLLTLTAGNNISFDNNTAIVAGNNWSVSLAAGTAQAAGSIPQAGNAGIYFNGNAYLQTQNGDITLSAYNEVIVNSGAVRTLGGGSIDVTTQFGDVNTGDNINGYVFASHNSIVSGLPPYYTVNPALGGISTAAGGDVTITAGGNVISFLPVQSQYASAKFDAGSGAFGSQPGNVTITAGGSVYGNYVLANGIGSITAGVNVGVPLTALNQNNAFLLSLINGSWSVYAPLGSIYVDDIVNPNGIFDDTATGGYPGYHYFDYGLSDSILLAAGNSVEITGNNAPQSPPSAGGVSIPVILPPSLQVVTGTGDFTLDTSVILFPSPNQNLNLSIAGNFIGIPGTDPINLEMSDSAASCWSLGAGSFGINDHSTAPPEINNPNTVQISVGKDMDDINLYTTMATTLTVGGNLNNSGFVGQNLHATDTTTINVAGQIYNSPLYTFIDLNSSITSANPLQSGAWDSFFELAINPALLAQLQNIDVLTAKGGNSLVYYLQQYLLFPSGSSTLLGSVSNPGFVYDPASQQLGFKGNMSALLSSVQINLLSGLNANGTASATPGVFTVLKVDAQGNPITDAFGHLEFTTYNFTAYSQIAGANGLYAESLQAGSATAPALGYQIGGPGTFNITAGSMNLGNSSGIQSLGFGGDYFYLENACGVLNSGGAAVNVNVAGDLDMITSAIDSQDGGDVNVTVGGDLNLSQGNFNFNTVNCYGIYTSGHSDVNVYAAGDINVGSARIATFNGGNVSVTSGYGDVNAGNGDNQSLLVYGFYISPLTGLPTYVEFGDVTDANSLQSDPAPFGSGILAESPTAKYWTPGGNQDDQNNPVPGNITVATPYGNITSGLGGISQIALHAAGTPPVVLNSGSLSGPLTLSLSAGFGNNPATPPPATADQGNIDVSVVIGVNVNLSATGKTKGIFVSQQNLDINAQSFSGLCLAGGLANISVSQAGDGPAIVVGIGGVSASGLGAGATLLGQNVSVDGGSGTSTLGSSANATSASQSAAQQSSQAAQQVASNDAGDDDQDKKKKKPEMHRSKRVTVILPKSS